MNSLCISDISNGHNGTVFRVLYPKISTGQEKLALTGLHGLHVFATLICGNLFCCNSPSSHIILFEVRGSITSLGFFCRSEQTELGNNPRETFPRKPSRTSEAWWWPFKGLRGFPDKLLLTEDFTDCVTLSSSFVHFIHFSSKFIHLHRLSAILIPFLHFHPL